MEKVNIKCSGTSNVIKTIFWILSLISWLLLIIIGWIETISFYNNEIIWTILNDSFQTFPTSIKVFNILIYYIPSQMGEEFIYIVFIVVMSFLSAGFIMYIIGSIFMKDKNVFNGMMGTIARFHFIPFICASALFFIGITYKDSDSKEELIVASFCFSSIGICTLILIYFRTSLNSPWYFNCLIKKGAYSCLIVLFSYNTFYNIIKLGIVRKIKELENKNSLEQAIWIYDYNLEKDELNDFMKNCRIGIPLAIGVFNLGLAFIFKDIIIPAINLLIYLGCIICYYDLNEDTRKNMNDGEIIIDIILLVLSGISIGLIIGLFKKKVLE